MSCPLRELARTDIEFADALHAHLLAAHRRVLLLIDEFELQYKLRADGPKKALADCVHRQMHYIVGMDGPRTIMAVVTGSAAVLRALAFALGGPLHGYPCHALHGSLNDTKLFPVFLRLLKEERDLAAGLLCRVRANAALRAQAVSDGTARKRSGIRESFELRAAKVSFGYVR